MNEQLRTVVRSIPSEKIIYTSRWVGYKGFQQAISWCKLNAVRMDGVVVEPEPDNAKQAAQ